MKCWSDFAGALGRFLRAATVNSRATDRRNAHKMLVILVQDFEMAGLIEVSANA